MECLLMGVLLAIGAACVTELAGPGRPSVPSGPLRVHRDNPRYFADADGRAVLLTGFHTWNNLQELGPSDPPKPFDYEGYLDLLQKHGVNYIRLWRWEMPKYRYPSEMYTSNKVYHHCTPHPWRRTGPGKAADGKPRSDLSRFEPAYFERLRDRVARAGERGIYVSVMLFEGHCAQFSEEGWAYHPFAAGNNLNDIDADSDGDGRGLEFYTLDLPDVTRLQEAYVRKVIDVVNDLNNVFYEISNEAGTYSTEWQYHMIRLIREYEAGKPHQHLVGMTFQYKGGTNANLMASPADWISPNPDGGYRDEPPAADGAKVIVSDTDHLWGVGGNRAWIWKTFTRAMHPIFMDPWGEHDTLFRGMTPEAIDDLRSNLGYVQHYARKMDLASATPRSHLASSGFCVANPGVEYLVYLPEGGTVEVDLSAVRGRTGVEWFDPSTGQAVEGLPADGGGQCRLKAPFGGDAALYLRAQ